MVAATIMAFDFGAKRVGVAVGEPALRSAHPLKTLTVPAAQILEAVAPLVREWTPATLVVGRPTHPDGAPHALTKKCEHFAAQLQQRFRINTICIDERWTSAEAAAALSVAGHSARAQKASGATDALAATLILERYFETLA